MFLFSSPPQQPEPKQADHPLARPLRAAAETTGVPFDYLMRTAQRESNLNPDAKAASSSATGLFQFIEQTWFGLMKQQGPQLGLKAEADAIQLDKAGRYSVPNPALRQHILDLRKDPALSATMAGTFTQKNRENLREVLGRDPNAGELYMAHFLGAQGAGEFIARTASNPSASAAAAFPDAAAANRPVFFDQKGRARSLREVYARLSAFHEGVERPPAQPFSGGAQEGAVAALAPVQRSNNALHGLFRTGGDSASATNLRKAWSGFAEARLNKNAPSFFPRSEGVAVAALSPEMAGGTANDAPSLLVGSEAPEPVNMPVPPQRAGKAALASQHGPLDLTRFLKPKR